MEQGTCKLCGNFGDLKRSHIIPEAFYKPLYEEKLHQFHRYTTDAQRPKRGKKGFREPLLCPTCEHITEVYDDYAIKVWNDNSDAKVQYHPRAHGLLVTGVDYVKMKFFFIITLWRMGVSSLPDFSGISLGEKHENKLRQMIRDENPGRQHEYPFFLFGSRRDPRVRKIMLKAIAILGPCRIEGHKGYNFLIGSLMWQFFVSSHINDPLIKEHCSLKECGELMMYQNDDLIEKTIRETAPRLKGSR
jgi:hypothetical protein